MSPKTVLVAASPAKSQKKDFSAKNPAAAGPNDHAKLTLNLLTA